MPVPVTGQVTAASPGVALSTTPRGGAAFIVKAPQTNAAAVYLGDVNVTSGNGYQLDPGETFEYQRNLDVGPFKMELAVSDFYVAGTGPDKVSWLVSP